MEVQQYSLILIIMKVFTEKMMLLFISYKNNA